MTAAALIADLRSRGVELLREGQRLRYRARRGVLREADREALAGNRDELVELLRAEVDSSPAARLEAAWSHALARADAGFHKAEGVPEPEDLTAAAALELRGDPGVEPPFGPVAQATAEAVLPGVYEGKLVARIATDGMVHAARRLSTLRLRSPYHEEPLPTGKMLCAGCSALMPEHSGGLCFCCDLGVDQSDFPTQLLPAAFALREEHGPAGRRGVRVEAIRALGRRRHGARRQRPRSD